jgi:hypothetical protein
LGDCAKVLLIPCDFQLKNWGYSFLLLAYKLPFRRQSSEKSRRFPAFRGAGELLKHTIKGIITMKRMATVLLLLVAVGMMITSDVLAQVVKVKVEAMTPGRRSTGEPNYTAPAGPYYVSTGLPTVGKRMKVFLSADTTGSGTSTATSFAWTFTSLPAGSAAVFSSLTRLERTLSR